MSRSERKTEHIHFAIETGQLRKTGFDDIKFIHRSIPQVNVDDVRLDCVMGELALSSPIFINAMTGGGGEATFRVNRDLARVAKETGIAMAVGSQMAALKDYSERKTYEVVRTENPNGIIMANLGSEASVEQAKIAVDMIAADAIQIHLNVVQELTMVEGDRHFEGVLRRLDKMLNQMNVPVIVKEVGFGMSKETVSSLSEIGIAYVDVGGFGGTNFANIENRRSNRPRIMFDDWGIPTAVSVIEATTVQNHMNIIASGGIQTSLDVAKSLAIGASGVGMAGFLLKILLKEGFDSLLLAIHELHEDLAYIMTALGVSTIKELKHTSLVLSGDTHHWLNERNIDTKYYSQRCKKGEVL